MVVGQLTVRLPFRPGPNIDPKGVSTGPGVAVAEALASGLAAGVDVGEGDASSDGLGDMRGDGVGDTVGDGLEVAAFVTLITYRRWHVCGPQPLMYAVRTTRLPASPDASIPRTDRSSDNIDTRPGVMVQSSLICRGSTRRPLQAYCNFSVVFPSAISPGIPRTAQLPGSCSGGVCRLDCEENAAAIIRTAFVSSGPCCIAMPGIVASFEPRSISTAFVFVGRKL